MVITDGWLPIGSVVLVGGFEEPIMILGYLGHEEGSDTLWDYFGVPYPEGWGRNDGDVMFDRSGIEGVVYIGYQDERFAMVVDQLEAVDAGRVDGSAEMDVEGEMTHEPR